MDAEQYANHVNHLNHAGFTALLMSLGYELGLFDLMIKENRPLSSLELADIAGMKERYVREWLNGMAVGQVITYDAEIKKFCIAQHHRVSLREAACWAGGIGVFTARTEGIKKCFTKDGPYGLAKADDDAFWKVFGRLRKLTGKDFIEKSIVPNLAKISIADKLESGVNVLDACCGSGEFLAEFAKLFPKSTYTGLDFSKTALTLAKQITPSTGVNKPSFIPGDIQNLPDEMTGQYDIVMMFDALHDLPNPHKALSELHKVLKSDGYFILMDFRPGSQLEDDVGDLSTSMLYTASVFNCLPWSMATEPRIGYGTCWGRENITTALKQTFIIKEVFDLHMTPTADLFVCTRK